MLGIAIFVKWVLAAWGAWAFLNLLMMIVASTIAKPNLPCFTGFIVVMPDRLRAVLTREEYEAIAAHEAGHRRYMHPWINFALTCFLITPGDEMRNKQEHQADDYAAERGHAAALASALLKLSTHWSDIARAERLTRRYQ